LVLHILFPVLNDFDFFNKSVNALILWCLTMKKNNNKYRNNNNNMYNLNYRFDSLSPAGKCSGTALDLIKRYNDLAKEAHSGGNYVEMEVFRQYAEHYRKIVTEINERKNNAQPQQPNSVQQEAAQPLEEKAVADEKENLNTEEAITQKPLSYKKKTLKIVEVKESEVLPSDEKPQTKKRAYRKKVGEQADAAAV